ncbi:MAG: hypothetical protein GY697_13015, partial [Desulfobacterales bacterium]|nr:hypothetical protein [Desulfobacterales bacterium]
MSKTYHKTQGATYKSVILSLNSILAKASKIHKLSIRSLYVGASRVHNFNEIRILPLTNEERKALTKLTIDPVLRTYFKNYKNGSWIRGGLRKEHQARKREKKLELGMIDFDSLTTKDCEKFVTKLDLHVEHPKTLERLKERLKEVHAKARAKLKKDNWRLLKQKRIQFTKELLKEKLTKMNPEKMRYYAKRLGFKGKGKTKKILSPYLQNIIKKAKTGTSIEDNFEDINSVKSDTDSNSDDDDVLIDMYNDNPDLHITAGGSDYESDSKEPQANDNGPDDDENDEKGIYIVGEDIAMPDRPEQDTTNNGRIFYQTDYYTIQQLNHITKTKAKVRMLFGDNDRDNYRNTNTPRKYCGYQASVMGHY